MKKKSIIIISVIILLLLGFLFFNKPINDNSSSVFRAIKTFFTGQTTSDVAYENEESAYHDDPTASDETNCCDSFVSTAGPDLVTETEGRDLLKKAGVSVNKVAPTTENGTKGTRIAGLPRNAIKAAIDIKNGFGQSTTITGGTENGHKTHGCGKAIFDLRSDVALVNWIKSKDRNPMVNGAGNKKYTFTIGGQSVSCTFEEYPPFYKQARGRDNLPTSKVKKGMAPHSPHLHCEVNLCVAPATRQNTTPQTNTIKK